MLAGALYFLQNHIASRRGKTSDNSKVIAENAIVRPGTIYFSPLQHMSFLNYHN